MEKLYFRERISNVSVTQGITYTRNYGQATIMGLVLILISATTVVLLYNTGQTAAEKTRLVNAADAAAYSGAIFVARNLNFMAYTNRAMIANHVAVGHFISYLSWIRYVKNVAGKLDRYARLIPFPPLPAASRAVDKWAEVVKEITEGVGKVYIPASDSLNELLHLAQRSAKSTMVINLAVGTSSNGSILNKVAKEYSSTIKINNPDELASSSGFVSAAQIKSDMSKIFRLTTTYNASNDNGRIKRMVNASLGDTRRFIDGNRGWPNAIPYPASLGLKLYKDGNTKHKVDDKLMDWKANDRLTFEMKIFRRWRFRWITTIIGEGKATASEYAGEYKGITGYYDMKNPEARKDHVLTITAYATMPMDEARPFSLLGLKSSANKIAAVSRAEISHQRPEPPDFNAIGKGEYSNVFNPFWQARLIDSGIGL